MKKIIVGLLICALVACLGFSFLYSNALNYSLQKNIDLEIKNGEGFNNALAKLQREDSGISLKFAKLHLKMNGLSKALKSGEYSFSQGQSLKQAIADFVAGNVVKYKVIIPEGYNSFEIADVLVAKEIITSKKDFLKVISSKALVESLLGFEALSLEGFLYPSTYEFSKRTNVELVIKILVDAHKKSYAKLLKGYKLPKGFTHYQLVTLASVVEKETGASEERPLIASVFHNRLKKKMRLQSDPTTIYGQWVKSGERLFNIRKRHLQEQNPFNTYTVRALPIGPISNPGFEAMKAVCDPATSDFLYFVSKNDGTHYFSKTYKEHGSAVRKYQMSKKARTGKSWRDLNKKK